MTHTRLVPIGAELQPGGGVHFRVWAPQIQQLDLVLERDRCIAMERESGGYFSGFSPDAAAGTLYRFRLDGEGPYPDPASRFQPEGPHGPSEIIDPSKFGWTDAGWPGVSIEGQVLYEMHIGTFTRDGTLAGAMRELPELAAAGITVLEVMPVADFPGRFGWGYDGVCLYAPTRLYGRPDDLRRFVNRAHELGLAVILDVVYNHFGPDGNFTTKFSPHYVTDRYENDWGDSLNFDGENSGPVREFFTQNAAYWIREFHLDGLRLDATQSILDQSPEHVLAAISRTARAAAGGRSIILVAENEPQHTRLVRPLEKGGYGLDALWNDDFHHSAMVALTGRNEAYYSEYLGSPQEFLSAAKWGCLYQGQLYKWQKQRRGSPSLDIPPTAFVTFLQNHDQVANSSHGLRCQQLTSPGRLRAMTALLLLCPGTPMLFQGQEFGATSPFLYFADHGPELTKLVRRGRADFLKQFPSLATPEGQELVHDPSDPAAFERSKLNLAERRMHPSIYALHHDLLRLRREDPVFRAQRPRGLDGAVLGPEAFVLRFFGANSPDRLLFVNFGRNLRLDPAPEPLLAPPESMRWRILFSTENPRYGGGGTPPLETDDNWRIPGQAAVVLAPESQNHAPDQAEAHPQD